MITKTLARIDDRLPDVGDAARCITASTRARIGTRVSMPVTSLSKPSQSLRLPVTSLASASSRIARHPTYPPRPVTKTRITLHSNVKSVVGAACRIALLVDRSVTNLTAERKLYQCSLRPGPPAPSVPLLAAPFSVGFAEATGAGTVGTT